MFVPVTLRQALVEPLAQILRLVPMLPSIHSMWPSVSTRARLVTKLYTFGDLLFALVNYARHRGWDPEQSLAQANDKFLKRFKAMEALLAARGEPNAKQSLEVWDALWNQVKRNEN